MDDVRREQIGIVGVGNMGGAIGRSMLREGINLTAFDVNETARSAIAELGATIAPTLDALARTCKVISIVVVTDEGRRVAAAGERIVDGVHGEVLAALPAGDRDIFAHALVQLASGYLERPAEGERPVRRPRQSRGRSQPG